MEFLRTTFLFVSLFALSSAFAFAQNTGGIKGKVRTMRGTVISEASVTARQNGNDIKTTTTNNKGEFVLDGLAAGNYNVVFS